jgi:hypothetical protein
MPGPFLEGRVRYIDSEYSFDFDVEGLDVLAEREGDLGRSSITIGTLQVEVGVEAGTALFVWGLHPRVKWRLGTLLEPVVEPGVVLFDLQMESGVSVELAPVGKWSTTFDSSNGWVRIAPDDQDDSLVAIASGTLLGHKDGSLHSVWLKPLMD